MIWKEKERVRIRAARNDNLICVLGIRRIDKVLNARIRELRRNERGGGLRID